MKEKNILNQLNGSLQKKFGSRAFFTKMYTAGKRGRG